MRMSAAAGFERAGPLLFFAGGIRSFGASQDNQRKTGMDTIHKQEKLLDEVQQAYQRAASPKHALPMTSSVRARVARRSHVCQ